MRGKHTRCGLGRCVFVINGLLWLLISSSGFAQVIGVSIPDTTAAQGDSVTIPILVGDLTDRLVIAYDSEIAFDRRVLEFVDATTSGTLSEGFGDPTVNAGRPDTVFIGGFGVTPLSGSGALINLSFKAVGQAGEMTTIEFIKFSFNAGDPPAETRDGRFTVSGIVESVDETNHLPQDFALEQNYPNPFNPETKIVFDLPSGLSSEVTLQVFNLQGQLVRTLLNARLLPGTHAVVWDGVDARGQAVASGVYVYTLRTKDFVATKKMLLLR
ncbi:MAG: cohesin domain-containing protein [bacterium]